LPPPPAAIFLFSALAVPCKLNPDQQSVIIKIFGVLFLHFLLPLTFGRFLMTSFPLQPSVRLWGSSWSDPSFLFRHHGLLVNLLFNSSPLLLSGPLRNVRLPAFPPALQKLTKNTYPPSAYVFVNSCLVHPSLLFGMVLRISSQLAAALKRTLFHASVFS